MERIRVALAGNPNSGKSTLFNALTGARQHVGNYPGITVEKKEGFLRHKDEELHIIDLPGAYSLSAFTQEELVARNFCVEERPDVVVDVLNAGALERNLYLAVQYMELGVPMVLALNMMDEVRKQGMAIDTAQLSRLINMPVVETVAKVGLGKLRLIEAAVETAEQSDGTWRPLRISYGPDLDPVLEEMIALISAERFLTDRYPASWLALKYLEGDEEILEKGAMAGETHARLTAMAEKVSEHCYKTLSTYPDAIIADYRYGYIASLLKQGVLKRDDTRARIDLSDRLDKVLTHRFAGPLIMLAILYLVYQLTFLVGEAPLGWMEAFFDLLAAGASAVLPDGMLRSLVVSGVIDGVGGVLTFVPLIMIMFFIIAFLEDSGYMARIAYMLDRVFRTFGLHGCSVMPFIVSGGIAGGCAVPGVMATRTLRSPREKLATMLTAPFMTCGAKLPVFILLTGVFFPRTQAAALFAITLGAWAVALVASLILRSTVIRGPSTPFVMELPPYRFPTFRGLLIHTWERTWQYLKKAGTVILAISILLWAAMTFPTPPESQVKPLEEKRDALAGLIQEAESGSAYLNQAKLEEAKAQLADTDNALGSLGLRHSWAGRLGTALTSVSEAAGFDWRLNIALIGGFAAKEVIISTLGTAYSLGDSEENEAPLSQRLSRDPTWNTRKAVAAIVFIMFYSPCLVTVVAIRQESGSWGWAGFSMAFNTILAFALAVVIFQGGKLL